jgi:hypothetical protein
MITEIIYKYKKYILWKQHNYIELILKNKFQHIHNLISLIEEIAKYDTEEIYATNDLLLLIANLFSHKYIHKEYFIRLLVLYKNFMIFENNDKTILQFFITINMIDVVEYLLDNNIDYNYVNNFNSNTPLALSIMYNNIDITRLLLTKNNIKKSINYVDAMNETIMFTLFYSDIPDDIILKIVSLTDDLNI